MTDRPSRPGRLTPMRRQVLDREFERLLELDDNARGERLRTLATRCPRLTRRLGTLLAALSEKADHLEAMIGEVAGSAVSELEQGDDELPPGTCLGAWRLLEPVGCGGMGRVYRAERADGAFEMEAAVKLIRVRRDKRLRTRLAMERRMLARLDHPNIARILDGGTTDDGQAFLVMEWVPGTDLNRCRDRVADTSRRCLDLFLRLAEAVNHAHQRQTVHGDIKPANVRIGEDGRVRLLDFGVARLLAGEHGDSDSALRALTPAWSAPELRAGEPASTQSDIWALGALLYWLLTGKTLDNTRNGCGDEVAGELSGRHARHRDLAAIVCTATAPDPDDRYSAVSGLIRDIETYRQRRPVSARRQTRRYVFGRFVQRNPVGVGLGTSAALLLLIGMAGTAWQAHEAAAERDRARMEAAKTEKVSEFLVGLFEQADPWQAVDRELDARDLVTRGTDQLQSLNEAPLVQAEMYRVLARVNRGLAEYKTAGELAAQSLEILESRADVSESARADAWSLRGATLASQGRYSEAETAHRRALELTAGSPPTDRAEALDTLGLTLFSLGRLDEAEALLTEALTIRETHLPDSAELAASYNNLALLLATTDRLDRAREYYEEALALRRSVLGDDHPVTSMTLTNLAVLLVQVGRFDAAHDAFEEALTIRRRAFGNDHPAVASVLYQLGWLHANRAEPGPARRYYEQALEIRRSIMGDDHPSVAVILNALASVARQQDELDSAQHWLEQALDIYRTAYGESHHDIALVQANLGATHMARGNYDTALGLLREALSMSRAELGDHHHHVADNLSSLAELYLRLDQRDEALRHAREAQSVYLDVHHRSDHPAIAANRELIDRIHNRP